MKTEEAFAIVLKTFRVKRLLTQEKLAHNCELDRTYISLLERGMRKPTLATIFVLAEALNVRPSELIRETEKIMGLTD
ncbi:helix-turn-helix transcriptional regulator [Psychrobacillus sp. MER TA 171]|uniref:helix-turn-helix domain-containing protein n=1 Tax=Psychrobacillus sp. MER TA 171 TaxID=2939577 RepID=UPI00203E12ED|nr:helix-turn-helix transcriptional regulator [Psychrobacillus sp. MER TA 171]MCM3359533.1 helix-turn-helix domain-containing protein [Psychrobacillus sp. MER TA 171]